MGTGEGMSEGFGEGIAEEWDAIRRDFHEGSDNSGSWALRSFCRSSCRVLFRKKGSYCFCPVCGIQGITVGWVCSSRRRVEGMRGSKVGLTLDEEVARVSGEVRQR